MKKRGGRFAQARREAADDEAGSSGVSADALPDASAEPRKLELDEEEQRIKMLEDKLAEYRRTLIDVLESGEKSLSLKKQALEEKEKELASREKELETREQELWEREARAEAELKRVEKLEKDIAERLSTVKKLEDKWEQWKREEHTMLAKFLAESGAKETAKGEVEFLGEDVKRLLVVMDELLEHLPDEVAEKFSKSEDYDLYVKVFEKYKIK